MIKAYEVTLSNYHSWPIRKTVGVALHLLPNRQQFVTEINAGRTHEEQIANLMALRSAIEPVQLLTK